MVSVTQILDQAESEMTCSLRETDDSENTGIIEEQLNNRILEVEQKTAAWLQKEEDAVIKDNLSALRDAERRDLVKVLTAYPGTRKDTATFIVDQFLPAMEMSLNKLSESRRRAVE